MTVGGNCWLHSAAPLPAWPIAVRAAIGDADDRIPQLGLAAADPSHEQSAFQGIDNNGVNSGLERRR
jgi:hypothetical protein